MFKRRTVVRFLFGVCGAVFYAEWFVYKLQPLFWNTLDCPTDSCVKILFIADPQIEGESGEIFRFWPLNGIMYQDADRYLRNTFSEVMQNFHPDVMVFLGDLMDEGSTSTAAQFNRYVTRLSEIFEINYPIQQIWLPGDNDIGGENEPIHGDKLSAFHETFNQADVLDIKNITFIKINGIMRAMPPPISNVGNNTLRIVLSHYPITNKHIFVSEVQARFNPFLYMVAHDHISKYVKQNKDLKHRIELPIKPGDAPIEITFQDALQEIYVPTCSYRMGVSKMGFGAAIVDNHSKKVTYTVLWSPGRFPLLFGYLFLVMLLIIFDIILCVRVLYVYTTSTRTNYKKLDDRNERKSWLKQV